MKLIALIMLICSTALSAPKTTRSLSESSAVAVDQKTHTFVITGQVSGFVSPMGSNDGSQFYTMTTVSGSTLVPVHCNKECSVLLNEQPLYVKSKVSGTVVRAISAKLESE